MSQGLRLTGTTLRARPLNAKAKNRSISTASSKDAATSNGSGSSEIRRDSTETSSNCNSSGGTGDNNPDPLEGLSAADVTLGSALIEKISFALASYGFVILLGSLSGVDATQALRWDGGAPLSVGVTAAVPAILGIALLFLPSLKLDFTIPQLKSLGDIDREDSRNFIFPNALAVNVIGDKVLIEEPRKQPVGCLA